MSEGWVCPKCTRSWAPWVATCTCNDITVASGTVTLPATGTLTECQHVYGDETSAGSHCRKCGQPAIKFRNTITVSPNFPFGNGDDLRFRLTSVRATC